MKFHNPRYEQEELTFDDVFLYQSFFEGSSRLRDISLIPEFSLWTSIPIVTANMNAVSGKRMVETIARYGGLGILPQDMDMQTILRIIAHLQQAPIQYDTPMTVQNWNTVRDALGIVYKRAHRCVILVDEDKKPMSLFTPSDLEQYDPFMTFDRIKKKSLIVAKEGIWDQEAFELMEREYIQNLPIVNEAWRLVGVLTKKNAVRNALYNPTTDKNWSLTLGVALGINAGFEKVEQLIEKGIQVFVLDTAHGYQRKMVEAIHQFRSTFWKDLTLIAGNVITKEWTQALLEAGANGVKVWVWPGAMCTTRMQTAVGRPQFSAIYHCAKKAKSLWWFVRADGGIKHPRDFCLALSAGANHVMMGTLFAGTYESTGEIKVDEQGRFYKENYGMASQKAVFLRNADLSPFQQAQKALFREGISTSKIYLSPMRASVGDLVDEFTTGLRSSMTYVGAKTLKDYYEKAEIWIQNTSWYLEGTPHGKIRQ